MLLIFKKSPLQSKPNCRQTSPWSTRTFVLSTKHVLIHNTLQNFKTNTMKTISFNPVTPMNYPKWLGAHDQSPG